MHFFSVLIQYSETPLSRSRHLEDFFSSSNSLIQLTKVEKSNLQKESSAQNCIFALVPSVSIILNHLVVFTIKFSHNQVTTYMEFCKFLGGPVHLYQRNLGNESAGQNASDHFHIEEFRCIMNIMISIMHSCVIMNLSREPLGRQTIDFNSTETFIRGTGDSFYM